jgi:hypothetical protein
VRLGRGHIVDAGIDDGETTQITISPAMRMEAMIVRMRASSKPGADAEREAHAPLALARPPGEIGRLPEFPLIVPWIDEIIGTNA